MLVVRKNQSVRNVLKKTGFMGKKTGFPIAWKACNNAPVRPKNEPCRTTKWFCDYYTIDSIKVNIFLRYKNVWAEFVLVYPIVHRFQYTVQAHILHSLQQVQSSLWGYY